MERVFIVEYNYNKSWIIGKLADDTVNYLTQMGYQCRVGQLSDYQGEEIVYHLNYHRARPIEGARHNSVFYTHSVNLEYELDLEKTKGDFDSYICMSPEDAQFLIELGFNSDKVYGRTLPIRNAYVKPLTIGIFSACYSNVIFYQQGVKYTMKIFHIQNVDYIKKFIELNPDKYFIYNNEKECMGIKEDTYFDTFNSNFKNIIYRYSYKMLNSKKDFEKEIKNIDYIITLNIIEFEMPSLKDVDEIPIKNKLFKIFKVKNKNKFPIMSKYSRNISTSIIRKMHNTKYIIYSADDNCIKLPSQKYIKEPVIDLSKGKYEIEIKTANIESCKIQISTFNKIINHTMTGNKIFFSLESDTKSVVTSFRNISNSDIIINDITIKKIK